jgi:predicted nucleic acid-binding protein
VILVDTSAWVEFLRGTGSAAGDAVRDLLEARRELATTDVVLMEVLAGARDARDREQLRRLLARCEFVPTDSPGDYEAAADLYRVSRAAGETVRSLTDCLIGAVAIRAGLQLLDVDSDFAAIARHSGLSRLAGARHHG